MKKSTLQIIGISLFVGLAVFISATHYFKEPFPCANSLTCDRLTEEVDNSSLGTFAGRTVIPPQIDLAEELGAPVLGTTDTTGEKHIYVNLATQKLYAFAGSEKVMETYTSTGKWGRTPTGNFRIYSKFRATRMAGGSGADYYNLPNVPHTMYFYGDYGIHGAYWHNNFGHVMSHGCVNLRLVDAKTLFEWAEIGTPVSVCTKFSEPNLCEQEGAVN